MNRIADARNPRIAWLLALLSLASGLCCNVGAAQLLGHATPLIQQLEEGGQQTVVIYGTSLTAGGAWGQQVSSTLSSQFLGQLTWINSGLSGKASASGVANLQDRVLDKNPDAVFIEFGMNDAFTEYPSGDIDGDLTVAQARENLETMVDAIIQQNPDAQIVVQTMNPSWDAPNGNLSGTKRPNLPNYYQMYRDVAQQRELLLVDSNKVWTKLQENQPNVFAALVSDGTHPGATGYARYVSPAILHALGAQQGPTLLVDLESGRVALHNESDDTVSIISYTISSAGESLLVERDSLSDQGVEGWVEANPTSRNLTELNPEGAFLMNANVVRDLGQAWDTSKALDLEFLYQTPDGEAHAGPVVYTSDVEAILPLAGDYNGDRSVDAADYAAWRNTLGEMVTPGEGADGDGNGEIGLGDYNLWRKNYGMTVAMVAPAQPSLTQAAPEPLGVALLLLGLMLAPGSCCASRSVFA